jgi:hypothetical protein
MRSKSLFFRLTFERLGAFFGERSNFGNLAQNFQRKFFFCGKTFWGELAFLFEWVCFFCLLNFWVVVLCLLWWAIVAVDFAVESDFAESTKMC